MIDNSDYEELVCPYCYSYIQYNRNSEEIICNQCNNKINEEIEYVQSENTPTTGKEVISTQTT